MTAAIHFKDDWGDGWRIEVGGVIPSKRSRNGVQVSVFMQSMHEKRSGLLEIYLDRHPILAGERLAALITGYSPQKLLRAFHSQKDELAPVFRLDDLGERLQRAAKLCQSRHNHQI